MTLVDAVTLAIVAPFGALFVVLVMALVNGVVAPRLSPLEHDRHES